MRVVEQKKWEALGSAATLPSFVSELKTELQNSRKSLGDLQDNHKILLVARNHTLLFKTKGSSRKFQALGVEEGPETSPKCVFLWSERLLCCFRLNRSVQEEVKHKCKELKDNN